MINEDEKSVKLFENPFSKEYWKLASDEMRDVRMIVLAGMLTALRIAIKSLIIPVGENLSITFGYLVNAVGSMIYGPVIAIFASAISDTLGAILFPQGVYFLPFILVEIAGGLIFALFYYRAKMSAVRVILGRFAVTLIANLILTPIIMYFYYMVVMGRSYTILSLPRMIKNLVLFPLESLILILLFHALIPVTTTMGLTYSGSEKLKINKQDIALIIVMTVISAGVIFLYYKFMVK